MHDRMQPRKSIVRRLFLVGASIGVGAIGWFLLGESETLSAAENKSDAVLARVAGEEITESEVTKNAAGELLKVERQRHELIADAVKQEVRNRLMEAEAKKRGISREELLEAEINSKMAAVTDAEIDQFFEERKAQIRATKEQAAPQIKQFLEQQQRSQAYEAWITKLEESAKVEYLMDPFRVPIEAKGPSKGPDSAPVTIVEFSDFECPFCSRVGPTLKQIEETYGDKVKIVFRQFPLAIHRNARKAGEASLCAADQDKFWEMHDAMFADQKNLGVDALKEKAAQISGIDSAAFNTCLDSGKHEEVLDLDMSAGAQAGVSGTPAFFVNGRFLSGAVPFENFSELINEELARHGKDKS